MYGRTIIKHDIEPFPDSSLHFSGALRTLPSLGLALAAASGVHLRRTTAQIQSDDLILNVTLAGGRVMRQLGREVVVGKGEAVLSTSAEVGTCDIYGPSQWISIRIPFKVLAPMVADLDAVIIRPIPTDNEALSLLVGYIGALQDTHALARPELHRLIAGHVNELVALTVGATSDATEIARGHGLRAARLAKILHDIDDRAADPGLSAAQVASQLGVTPRYVHALLEETGRTFSRHVLEKRLDRAMALLRAPRARAQRIADVAFEVGFGDLSYFNRVFRRRFGETPSGVRANAARSKDGR